VWCSNMIIDPLRSVKASDKAAEREHYFLPSPVSRTGSRAVIRLVALFAREARLDIYLADLSVGILAVS
jgi:hypothetical protein